jgi:hypothetical protein
MDRPSWRIREEEHEPGSDIRTTGTASCHPRRRRWNQAKAAKPHHHGVFCAKAILPRFR